MISVRFYKRLFPAKRMFFYLWCTWRQYRNFTTFKVCHAVNLTCWFYGAESLKGGDIGNSVKNVRVNLNVAETLFQF